LQGLRPGRGRARRLPRPRHGEARDRLAELVRLAGLAGRGRLGRRRGGGPTAALLVLVAAHLAQAAKRIVQRVARRHATADPAFARTLSGLFGPALLPVNRIDTFVDGRQIFPAMLEAIDSAQASVTFETFIDRSGSVGERVAQALIGRARAGVPVHVRLG
jgi:phosphatidylserine/phosphatidylglycerophosphate/cardiolipin synthase-like enzyme